MSKEKDKMLTIITNKIEELQKDNETLIKYCEKHPETLYSEKCFKLYIKMLEQYSRNWCD